MPRLLVRSCLLSCVVWLGCSGGAGSPPTKTGQAGATAGQGGAGQSGQSGQGGGGQAGGGSSGQAGTGTPMDAAPDLAAAAGADAAADVPPSGVDAPASVDATTDAGTEAGPAAAGCAAPGTLCWDFEEGKLPTGWTPYRNEFATGSLAVDGTRPHKGKYALHAKDFSGNKEGSDGGPKHTMRFNLPAGFGPVLWGRAFIYMTPATPMSHAGFFNARYPRPNAAATSTIDKLDWYEVATSAGKYVSIWHPPEPPGTPEFVQISDTAGVVDGWACVEWLFDAQNGAAAEAAVPRVWVNGTELAWPMTLVAPTGVARPTQEKAKDFTVLESGVYLYQGLSTVTNWWIDDLAVGKQRVGCE